MVARRHVVRGRAVDRDTASTSQVARSETDVLCHPDSLDALMTMPGQRVDRIRQCRPTDKPILDLDSPVSPTYGQQEGTAYNGHFGCEWYHPLVRPLGAASCQKLFQEALCGDGRAGARRE